MLDIGCGRGEFLEMMRDAGVRQGHRPQRESVAICRHKGLDAEVADLFVYLETLPEASLDGIFCSQVVEHLPPDRLPGDDQAVPPPGCERGGVIAIETPNPECLAIFATHFYLDPTHSARSRIRCWRSIWRSSASGISKCGSFAGGGDHAFARVAAGGFPRGVFRRAWITPLLARKL